MELQAIWIGPEDNGDSDYVQSIQVNTQYIAIGTSNSEIILLTSDGEYVRTIYDEQLAARRFTTEKAVLIMVLTHDRLLYSGIDGMLRVRDLSTGDLVHLLEGLKSSHKYQIRSIALLNGSTVATGCENGFIRIWNIDTGRFIFEMEAHSKPIYALAVRGNRLISGSHDHTVKIWDWANVKCLHTLTGHRYAVRSFIFYQNRLISSDEHMPIRIWDLESGAELATIGGSERIITRHVRLLKDQDSLVSYSNRGDLQCWSLTTFKTLWTQRLPTRKVDFVDSINNLLAIGDSGKVHLWHFGPGNRKGEDAGAPWAGLSEVVSIGQKLIIVGTKRHAPTFIEAQAAEGNMTVEIWRPFLPNAIRSVPFGRPTK